MASSGVSACAPPADLGEVFLEFGADIKRVVWRQLGPSARPQDVEDGVSYIFQQFVKNRVIEQYKPDYRSGYTGEPVKPKAFLMAKVALYCRGLRENLARQRREVLMVDAPAGENGATPWIDLVAGTRDEYPSLEDGECMEWLRAALEARQPEPGRPPVLPLFDALAERFRQGKPVCPAAVRVVGRRFKMSGEESDAWFAELKEVLREAAGEQRMRVPDLSPPPEEDAPEPEVFETEEFELEPDPDAVFELGGMMLTEAEVRAAIDAQKSAPGNRVLPAWQDARHKLAGAGKTWYLAFAKQVMKDHPALRTPKGGHYEGGHFGRVKAALIFGMERMLDAAPPAAAPACPEPAPDAAVWRELEAVLVRLPGATTDSAEAALEAARLLLAAA